MRVYRGERRQGLSYLLWLVCRLVCRLVSWLVPRSLRGDWRREWMGELWHLYRQQNAAELEGVKGIHSLVFGMVADAAWLRVDELRRLTDADSRDGSSRVCLERLGIACLLCAVTEGLLQGSWHGLIEFVVDHFTGCFVFVVLPSAFVAWSTSPLRPRKCDRKRSRLAEPLAGFSRFVSAGARWNLFLGGKVLLALVWAFLLSAVIATAAHRAIGHWADWVELLSTALAVILSLRWALLDQERRCQHCLKLLSQPTRVGFASRNFLDWNGTELYCADGHGLLHVTEMEGSWCWYDLWVELDPTWHGLFSA